MQCKNCTMILFKHKSIGSIRLTIYHSTFPHYKTWRSRSSISRVVSCIGVYLTTKEKSYPSCILSSTKTFNSCCPYFRLHILLLIDALLLIFNIAISCLMLLNLLLLLCVACTFRVTHVNQSTCASSITAIILAFCWHYCV